MSEKPPLVAGADAAVVAGQLGRAPHAMSAVAARCPFGFPAVVEDLPYDRARPAVPDAVLLHLSDAGRRRLPPGE